VGSTISSLIAAAEKGDSIATDALFGTLYSELHRLATRELARQGAPVSLSVTTLLHEAYLDLAGREGTSFRDRARFTKRLEQNDPVSSSRNRWRSAASISL